jgi:hypothetical protein
MKQVKSGTLILCAVLVTMMVLATGCVNQAETKITPGADLGKVHKIYVEHFDPDRRELNKLIAAQFNKLGYEATTSLSTGPPKAVRQAGK